MTLKDESVINYIRNCVIAVATKERHCELFGHGARRKIKITSFLFAPCSSSFRVPYSHSTIDRAPTHQALSGNTNSLAVQDKFLLPVQLTVQLRQCHRIT